MFGLIMFMILTGTTPQLRTQGGVTVTIVPAKMSAGALVGQGLATVFSLMVGFFCLRQK